MPVDYEHLGALEHALENSKNQNLYEQLTTAKTKKSKTTGKSPRDTAFASAAQRVINKTESLYHASLKDQQQAHDKIVKDAEDAAKKAAKEHEDELAHPERASQQQSKQAEALVEGMKAMWAKGTLPANVAQLTPVDVGTVDLKGETKKADQTAPGQLSPEISAAAQAEYQRTGQMPAMTTEKVTKLQSQIDEQKSKIQAADQLAGKKHKSFWGDFFDNPLNVGNYVDAAAQAGSGAMDLAARGIDIASRPGYAVSAGWETYSDPDKSMTDVLHSIGGGFTGEKKKSFIDVVKANQPLLANDPNNPGQKIQYDPATKTWGAPKEINPFLAAPVGLAGDVLTNPLTYVGVGTVAEAAKGIQAGTDARAAVDVNNSVIKAAMKTAGQKGVTSIAEKTGKDITEKIAASGGHISGKVTAHEALANDLYAKAIVDGVKAPDALAAVRVAIERQVTAEAAKQKMATLAMNALKNNRRVLNLKVAGKELPLGKVPLVDIPYQGARALKAKAAATEVGQGLSKMFSTRYWFPGETHTLFNKANSMGVHAFTEQHNAIRDAFRGLSKADRIRIADETEKGVSLAGELGTKGHDLGPAQKFFQEVTAHHFQEAQKILGKYASSDEVKDYVYHHYRGGSAAKIRDIKKVRKERFEAGATGADRLTLQEADDLKLRPVREADKILLAHTADHQRQMIREMFNRKMIDTYGHVTDNPILAQKLGLETVKPPKSMKMAPGHALYMHPDIKKVYTGVRDFMGKNDEETNRIWRYFDKGMRGWKMANTTLRPGHHIRNIFGDMFLNYQDGVQNPYRYQQGLRMATGQRSKVKIRVGNQVLNGDDIERLLAASGTNKGFISSEFLEGRNPILNALQGFSQGREMTGRYAHFIDVLVKEGQKANLGANNKAGLYKIATEAGRRVNKWNINYADLTPFERNTMKRVMPFYTWFRKAMPLMVESLATRPGRMQLVPQLNNFLSTAAGINPNDTSELPYPQWLKDVGFARIGDGQEPNVWSLPLPPQDLGRWFGGGNVQSLLHEGLSNINPIAQAGIEWGMGKNIFTGAQLDPNEATYAAHKFGVVQNILDTIDSSNAPANRLNSAFGLGTRNISEKSQLSELRRRQDPLDVQIGKINKDLGNYEVHKLKYGYSVYNKHFKITEKSGFSTAADALIYAIGLNKKEKGK
jgi:hypothetical protein